MLTNGINAFPDDPLVQSIKAHVKDYMKAYDASHSWDHIERVVDMAHNIYAKSDGTSRATMDLRKIHLAALLHDVGDRKYLLPGQDASTQIQSVLLSYDAPSQLAQEIQTICSGVSYTTETRDPAKVASLIQQFPELAVVQDADRLDAIGAVGIGRMFTFGGAKTDRTMDGTMEHLDDKLFKLEGMMKTAVGRELARERTERMREFKRWWNDEFRSVS
ncbi:HD/Pproductase domain-containing protein [Madurella fahalii]|uniref:HD/Pproductase domain-containing protein n=1 Tax=Madurella fahalii TaxID=1157608 RepID=A0ABQ0G837_9PEZI